MARPADWLYAYSAYLLVIHAWEMAYIGPGPGVLTIAPEWTLNAARLHLNKSTSQRSERWKSGTALTHLWLHSLEKGSELVGPMTTSSGEFLPSIRYIISQELHFLFATTGDASDPYTGEEVPDVGCNLVISVETKCVRRTGSSTVGNEICPQVL